jgi:hypothetical protein
MTPAPGVSILRGGAVHAVRPDGLPGAVIAASGLPHGEAGSILDGREANPIVMVHGFEHDPASTGRDNPHVELYPKWRGTILPPGRPGFGFGWYSLPAGLSWPRSIWEAWRHGRALTYRRAWDLAWDAGNVLATTLARLGGPVDLIAHSLGTRVALRAIRADPALPIRRVLLLNGAEYAETAFATAANAGRHLRFYNVVVPADDVLGKLGRAAPGFGGGFIGRVGLGGRSSPEGNGAPDNWCDLELDRPAFRAWAAAQGWHHVAGDNPNGIGDHWHSYENPGNWPLYKKILAGGDLDPPRS